MGVEEREEKEEETLKRRKKSKPYMSTWMSRSLGTSSNFLCLENDLFVYFVFIFEKKLHFMIILEFKLLN